MFKVIPIRHPEWLDNSHPQKSIDLYRRGIMPQSVAGWSIVVGLKHPLRAIYGSDVRAALALLHDALAEKWYWSVSAPIWKVWGAVRYGYAWLYSEIYYLFPHHLGGRRFDPDAVRCECGWGGMRRWTLHTYSSVGDESEPVDECPRCGDEI